jgi:hypothetical protein
MKAVLLRNVCPGNKCGLTFRFMSLIPSSHSLAEAWKRQASAMFAWRPQPECVTVHVAGIGNFAFWGWAIAKDRACRLYHNETQGCLRRQKLHETAEHDRCRLS